LQPSTQRQQNLRSTSKATAANAVAHSKEVEVQHGSLGCLHCRFLFPAHHQCLGLVGHDATPLLDAPFQEVVITQTPWAQASC
jgi:hypothetical protein